MPSESEIASKFQRQDSREDHSFHVLYEGRELLRVALPSVLMQLALYWIFPVSVWLVAASPQQTWQAFHWAASCLVGNLTCLSIMEGSLSAADTLMPRAYGSHQYSEVARLAIRAFCTGCILLAVPVIPLCFLSAFILELLGQDPQASYLAQAWIRVYFWGALPNLGYRVLMRFLLAQAQPWPLVLASAVPACLIHPFLVSHLVQRMGFKGSACSIVITQWLTFFLLLGYLWVRPVHHPDTWPGLSKALVEKALRLAPTWQFVRLSIGGILSMNEWWFFEIMCFIAGRFGVVSLDAHTVAYNLIPLLFMLPLGISIGLTIRMGHVIAYDPKRATLMATWCMAFITVFGAMVAYSLHLFRYRVIRIFTNSEDVLSMALDIWPSVCLFVFFDYIICISISIYLALGMQWRAAFIIAFMLYGCAVPSVIYFASWKHGGLHAQWHVLPACYALMQLALASGYIRVDWKQHSNKIRIQMQSSNDENSEFGTSFPSEDTSLLIK